MNKKLTLRNKKGLKLSILLDTPDSGNKFPTVLFFHGFKGYKEEATYADLAKKLLTHGIASVRFDASGFGDSEGTLEKDYRFSNYIKDTESVYDWLLKQKFVDKKEIGVIGQSMGGAQAVVFASNHPEIKFACAISLPDKVGTIDTLGKEVVLWKKKGFLEIASSRYKKKIRFPYAFMEDVMQYDFIKLVQEVTCPLLIVFGEKDQTVLPAQTQRVFDAASEPKTLLRIEDMDHFYKRDPKMLEEVNEKILDYVVKHMH